MVAKLGAKAPDFSLPADGGQTIKLSAIKGKRVVYFYPKDMTPGCTKEACAFRDAMKDLTKAGVTVIGISKDSAASHDKFKAKHDLNYALASDGDGRICEAYGVWVEKTLYGRKYMGIDRATFLIDAAGKVAQEWRKVRVAGHVEEVLAAAKKL